MASKRSRQAFEADLQKQESPYVFYGTALPPLDDKVRDDGSFVPLWKQEVTDDRGRKRLHGAFTGGFSAGYFNTVGSKEGWTPSTFVSSRNREPNEQKQRQQRIEDFMDEEDLREAEESRALQTADDFAGLGRANNLTQRSAVIDIFRPSGETVGEKLLKRMGWREGQGIGQRVRRQADLGEGQTTGELHLFAPIDVAIVNLSRKFDTKGLGLESSGALVDSKFGKPSSQRRHNAEDDDDVPFQASKTPLSKPPAVSKARKAGFGVGVLNDTGSDDEDPYSLGPKIAYNKTIGGDKSSRKKAIAKPTANPSLKAKPVLMSSKLSGLRGSLRKCNDGRLPLDGFELGDDLDAMASLSLKGEKYKPLAVPDGWKSAIARAEVEHESDRSASVQDNAGNSAHTSRSRGQALGEAPLPGKSVFDFLSSSARDRLALASGKADLPPGRGEVPSGFERSSISKGLQDLVPKLDQDVALQALNRSAANGQSWMPYGEDLDKRERYKTFLEIRAGLRATSEGDEIPPRAAGMTEDDWVLEMREFSRAAEVFQPVTGMMASRFVSSSSGGRAGGSDRDDLLRLSEAKPEDPAEAAAKMGMFGHLTRSIRNFYPSRLLCKRFGVSMPDISNRSPDRAPASDATSGADRFQSAEFQKREDRQPRAGDIHSAPASQAVVPLPLPLSLPSGATHEHYDTLDLNRNEVLEQEKPGMALFKAVFGSDDDDEDDD